ncbi:MAG: septum formation family protein [Actinomycetota bacterium]|nr:septum formation family protein [Actinomycetota bacterium]
MRARPARTARSAAVLVALPLALAACGSDSAEVAAPAGAPVSGSRAASAPPSPDESAPATPSGSPSASPAESGSESDSAGGNSHSGHTGGLVRVGDLAVGDCFDDVAAGLNEVEEVPVVPCEGPHANEVFAVLEQPGEEYPGEEEMGSLAGEGCYAAFEEYVGAPVETSALTAFPIAPTAESWASGDREVVCVLTGTGPRTGSAQGSGA